MSRTSPNLLDETSTRSRYPGTRPFTDSVDDRARFFGRAAEGEELYLRVLSVPLLVQFGKSGLGKTSLLQAGLFPRLRLKPFLPVMIRLNAADESLTFAVARSIQQACKAEGLEFTEGRADGLWELLSTTTVWRNDLFLTPVLVFDQFEEVFTLRDATFRAALAAELGALASGIVPERLRAGRSGVSEQFAARPNVNIVISLREDYLGALEEFSVAIPNLFHERLRLEPLTENAAREAITEPARLVAAVGEEFYGSPRFEFEPAALDSMIGYLKGSSGVIEPFQLQLLCRHAEAIARGKASTPDDLVTLTAADFDGSRGFDSVLKNFYRDTLQKLPGSQRRKAGELCEEGLLDASGHRLMLEEGQIRSEFGIKPETLTTLSSERLMRREPRHESVFYEISHDRLAEAILRSRRFRLPKNMRRALRGVAIVAPFVLAAGVYWVVSLHTARDKANSERQNAESFVSFLLGEKFLGEVRDTGRSTMLVQVREKAKGYEGAGDQGTALNRGLALRNAGDIERTRGTLAKSVALFGQALTVFETDPDNPDARREAARTHERLGDALADQGQVTRAQFHYEAAVKARRQVAISPGDPAMATDDCTSLADSLVRAGELKNRMGDWNPALEYVQRALKIASSVLVGRQTSDEECRQVASKAEPYPDAKALEVFSRAVLVRASILNFPEDYDGAAALAMEATRLRPLSISARINSLTAVAWRGNGRVSDPQAALVDYRNALAESKELRRGDPDNRLWQRERATAQLLVAGGIVACHESKTRNCKPMPALEDAEATSLEVVATLRALAQEDPSNASWQGDLGLALQTRAKVLAAQSRQLERLAALEEAEPYRSTKIDDRDSVSRHGDLLMDKASALAALDRQAEATATLQRSIDLFTGLIADHKDNPTYIGQLTAARQREAEFRRKAGDTTAANAAEREAARLNEQYEKITARTAQEAETLASMPTHVNAGAKLFNGGDYTAALSEFKAAESARREYVVRRPADFKGYDYLRNIYDWIQNTHEKLSNVEARGAALVGQMRAAQIAAALLQPEDPAESMYDNLRVARQQLGIFLNANNRFDEALAMVEEEVVVAERLVQGAQKDPHAVRYAKYLGGLGIAKCGLGMVRRNHRRDGWEEAVRSGLIHFQKAAEIDPKNSEYLNQLGEWQRYIAERYADDGHKEKALAQDRLALKTYQRAASVAPGNEEAERAIRELAERGVR